MPSHRLFSKQEMESQIDPGQWLELRYMLELELTFLLVNWAREIEKQDSSLLSGPSDWEDGGVVS